MYTIEVNGRGNVIILLWWLYRCTAAHSVYSHRILLNGSRDFVYWICKERNAVALLNEFLSFAILKQNWSDSKKIDLDAFMLLWCNFIAVAGSTEIREKDALIVEE